MASLPGENSNHWGQVRGWVDTCCWWRGEKSIHPNPLPPTPPRAMHTNVISRPVWCVIVVSYLSFLRRTIILFVNFRFRARPVLSFFRILTTDPRSLFFILIHPKEGSIWNDWLVCCILISLPWLLFIRRIKINEVKITIKLMMLR